MTIQERLARLREQNARTGAFCICGNILTMCPYHKPGADTLMSRAADLFVLLDEHHEIDYDSCSTDQKASIEDIAAYLRGDDL